MDIGEKILKRRKSLGLTLEDVGNAVGVGKSTVRKWETGIIKDMRRSKIVALSKVLQVSPAFIMGWELDEEEKKEKEHEANNIVANKIKKLSKNFEADKFKMAKYSNVSIEEFQSWIDGKESPNIVQLELLGNMYNKSISYFFSNDESEMSPEEKMTKQYRSLSENDRKKIEEYVDLLHKNQGGK